MPADYSAFKPTFGDTTNYANQINALIDAIQADMNLKLDISAVVYKPIAAKTADYAIGADDYTIEIDATISDVTITLPAAAAETGRILVFLRLDESIYRALIGAVHELFTVDEFVVLQSNGTAWKRIG